MMKLTSIARRRVLCALALGAFLTLTLVSQGAEPTFSTKPWDNGKTPIPADYQGVDLERLVESLTPKAAPKDEFESTSEYQARMKKALDDLTANGLYGDLKRDSRIPVAGNGSTYSADETRRSIVVNSTYDADNKRIGVEVDFPAVSKSENKEIREVSIEERDGTYYTLRYSALNKGDYASRRVGKTSFYLTGVDVEKARALKDKLGAVVVFTPERVLLAGSKIYAYTFRTDSAGSMMMVDLESYKEVFLNASNPEFWLYDKSTGEALAVLPLDWVAFEQRFESKHSLSKYYYKEANDIFEYPQIPIGFRISAQNEVDVNSGAFTKRRPSPRNPIAMSRVNLDKWRQYCDESKGNVQGWETRKATATLRDGENLSAYLNEYATNGTKAVSIPAKSEIEVSYDRNDALWLKYDLNIHVLPDGIVFQGAGEGEEMTTMSFDFDDYLCLPKGRRVYFKNIRFVADNKAERSNPMFVIFGFATFKDCEFVGCRSKLSDFAIIIDGGAEFARCRFRNHSSCGVVVYKGRMKASLCEFDGSSSPQYSSESGDKNQSSFAVVGVDSGRIEINKCYYHNCSTAVAGKPRRKTVIRDTFFARNDSDYWGTNAVLIQNLMWDDQEKDWKPLRLDPKTLPK